MKRILALLIAMMMVLSLASCGGETASNNEDEPSSSSQDGEKIDLDLGEDNKTDTEKKNEITFEELVVIDDDACSIKITEINNKRGFSLKAQLENKSADKTYAVVLDSASVNGVQCDLYLWSTVTAGKKANETIDFSDLSFDEKDIGEFTDIELTFRVMDANGDTRDEPIAYKTVHVYPYGEDKAAPYVREAQASDNVIIDNEYVTVTVIGYEDSVFSSGYSVELFLQNKTDTEVQFWIENSSVNGFMVNMFTHDMDVVSAGKCAFGSLYFNDESLEENGITEIEEIEMLFLACESDNGMGNYDNFLVSQIITINP